MWEYHIQEVPLLFVELTEQLLDIVLMRFQRLELVAHIITCLHVGGRILDVYARLADRVTSLLLTLLFFRHAVDGRDVAR